MTATSTSQATRARQIWKIVGIVLAVALALGGLAVAAAAVLIVIAFNSWGSNK